MLADSPTIPRGVVGRETGKRGSAAPFLSARVKRWGVRSIALLACFAVALAGCSNYRVTLRPEGAGVGDAQVAPRARVDERLIAGEPELARPEGWVRVRFNVDENGETHGIRILDSSDPDLEAAAESLLASWSYAPGMRDGTPAAVDDIEAQLVFAPAPWTLATPGQTAMVVGIIILAFAAIFVLALTTDIGGSWNGRK